MLIGLAAFALQMIALQGAAPVETAASVQAALTGPMGAPTPEIADACATVEGGAASVMAQGRQALRLGDGTCAVLLDGDSTVFFGGKPVAVIGARVLCPDGRVGVIAGGGASSVMVGGKPLALSGARVEGCD